MNKRVFSGIQPTGMLHIGNYLGAIKNWVELQSRHESFFSIVDYHAISSSFDPLQMAKRTFEAALINIAAGIDPRSSTVFVQSHVPEHTELAWILNTITSTGRLARMTQFKDKSRGLKKEASVGLFDYPVLQAADILLYKAEIVPVGDDQVQHLELARDLARKFNAAFGGVFPEPQALLAKTPRIMSLSDPTKKMSKSSPEGCIGIADSPEKIQSVMMRAVTDSGPSGGGVMSPGTANLFVLLGEFSSAEDFSRFTLEYERGGIRYSDLKKRLAEDIADRLAPIRSAKKELESAPDYIHDVLKEGARKARRIAAETMDEVRRKLGLYRLSDL